MVLKALTLPPLPVATAMSISKILKLTTEPSSQFILSPTYFFGPIAQIFTDISTIKIQVKTAFSFSIKIYSSMGTL